MSDKLKGVVDTFGEDDIITKTAKELAERARPRLNAVVVIFGATPATENKAISNLIEKAAYFITYAAVGLMMWKYSLKRKEVE